MSENLALNLTNVLTVIFSCCIIPKLEQERLQASLQRYQGDQQQTEPDSTAADDNVANENGSGGPTDDINEEIRKAKEVARSLAGKEVSSIWFRLF